MDRALAFLVIAFVISASPLRAQADELLGEITVSGQHSCSQSWASSSEQLSFALELPAQNGAARLRIELQSTTISGSQPMFGGPGETMQAPEPSRIHEHTRVLLEGSLTRTEATLSVAFTQMTRETARWSGWGTLPLGPASTTPSTLELTCTQTEASILPAGALDPEGGGAVPASIWRCSFRTPPDFLHEATREFPLAQESITRVVEQGAYAEHTFYRRSRATAVTHEKRGSTRRKKTPASA